MTLSIPLYTDYKSPYAYLVKDLAYALEDSRDIEIDWRPYTLDIPDYLGSAEVDAEGKATVVTGMTRLVEGELETLGLVLDAAGQPGLLVEGWYRRWVVTPDGEDSGSVSIDFCDCAC